MRIGSAKRWFLDCCSCVLILTAIAKLVGAFGTVKLLDYSDPIIPLSNRNMMLGSAALEVLVLFILLSSPGDRFKLLSLAWLASLFVVYQAGRWWLGIREPCPVSLPWLFARLAAFELWLGVPFDATCYRFYAARQHCFLGTRILRT